MFLPPASGASVGGSPAGGGEGGLLEEPPSVGEAAGFWWGEYPEGGRGATPSREASVSPPEGGEGG